MNEEYYINLIYKRISGYISESEKATLDNWIGASEENRITAKSVELAWNGSGKKEEAPDVNLDQEFEDLKSKLLDDKNIYPNEKPAVMLGQEPGQKSRKKFWYTIAASIVVLFSVAYFFRQTTNKPQEWVTVLMFEDTPMDEVIKYAEARYNVTFEVLNTQLNNCLFTSTFDNQDLDVFIETIATVLGVEVVKIDDTLYQVKGGACE